MDRALLIAWEKGYNAIPGIMAQDAKSWADMKMILRELKKTEVQEAFKCIVIDTIDIAAAACEKYVCAQEGVDSLGAIPWGQGWTKVKKELEETFRTITQLGYALFFISHAKDKVFKREDGTEYNQIVPTLSNSYNEIIKDMADIYSYAHQVRNENGEVSVKLTLRSMDGSADTGCRFKYITPEIDFTYQALVNALNEAIDKEAKITNNQFVTDTKNQNSDEFTEYDFDALMADFTALIQMIPSAKMEYYAPRITEITDKYLGKGKKVTNATRDQAEQIFLIVEDLKEMINKEG